MLKPRPTYSKLILAILLSLYSLNYLFHPAAWHFIDNVDLIIHEAGHAIFMFFGEFIYVCGGSFFQIAFPAVFSGYFLLRKDYSSSSVILMWVGMNIVNVAIYIGDSIVLQLPLLGGDTSTHDWHYILTHLGILKYTDVISHTVFMLGNMVIIGGIVLSVVFSIKEINSEPVHNLEAPIS